MSYISSQDEKTSKASRTEFVTTSMEGRSAMPDLVILEIFKYLPPADLLRVRQVCRQFRNLAECSTIWKEKDLCWSGDRNEDEKSGFFRALSVAPVLRTLTLRFLRAYDSPKFMTEFFKRHPEVVKKIHIQDCHIDMRDFRTIFRFYGQELEHLEIWYCETNIGANLIVHLALPKLKSFRTCTAEMPYYPRSIQVFGCPWPELQSIHFEGPAENVDQTMRILPLKGQLRQLSLYIEHYMLSLRSLSILRETLKHGFPLLERIVLESNFFDGGKLRCTSSSRCNLCGIQEALEEWLQITNVTFRILIYNRTCSVNLCFDKGRRANKLDKLTINQGCYEYEPRCEFENDPNNTTNLKNTFLKVLKLMHWHFPDLQVVTVNGCSVFVSTAREPLINSFPNIKFEFHSKPHCTGT